MSHQQPSRHLREDSSSTGSRRSDAEPGPSDARTVDRSVLAGFQRGDPAAVRQLYLRYGGAVYTIGMRALGDSSLAEEVVQQTFLRAWKAARRFDPDRDAGPWLYAIARRIAIDTYRRERRHRQGRSELTEATLVEHPAWEDLWEAWQVRIAVDGLPAGERDVMRAVHLRGLTHEEAAEALHIPVGTVKSRSWRAHRRLAEALGHLKDDGHDV